MCSLEPQQPSRYMYTIFGVKNKQIKGTESCVACEVLRGSEVHPSKWMFLAKPLVSVNFYRTDRHHVAKCSGGKTWITR